MLAKILFTSAKRYIHELGQSGLSNGAMSCSRPATRLNGMSSQKTAFLIDQSRR
ncbi:hypothetical protein K461DRAFT_272892 [Myriangium duriaei CBS 260.36]|uniref:Uncharacterized protein n=1 Tax=Myriangium duriaei CBS 260.36 TaxID=1168546 RepID=A0A9P4J7J8_9PEZI|nr:hypothetical protein K461DRAFT_272892 [Myriangium duriaei CBS 260.36]